jgi:hypothetical protein
VTRRNSKWAELNVVSEGKGKGRRVHFTPSPPGNRYAQRTSTKDSGGNIEKEFLSSEAEQEIEDYELGKPCDHWCSPRITCTNITAGNSTRKRPRTEDTISPRIPKKYLKIGEINDRGPSLRDGKKVKGTIQDPKLSECNELMKEFENAMNMLIDSS